MTPAEMWADARRKGLTVPQMQLNLESLRNSEKAKLYKPEALAELAAFLGIVRPEDDAAILSWRWPCQPHDGRLLAELVTLNGETAAELRAGTVARNFGWRLYRPEYWIIADDPDAWAPREQAGQAAVLDWGTGFKIRPAAATALLMAMQQRSIGLRGVGEFLIPPFKIPT